MIDVNIKSILAAECGSSTTTAVLIERNGDDFHLREAGQAPSTYVAPWRDITLGVQEAIRHIEKSIGRTLLAPGGWPITPQSLAGQGVDAFVLVSSAGPSLRVLLAGLTHDISLTSARRATAGTYTHVTDIISLDADDQRQPHTPAEQIKAIRDAQPDVILLVGGTDGGAEYPVIEMAQAITMALQLLDSASATVLYAGNQELRTDMADILGHIVELKSVDNIRPELDSENIAALQQELEHLYVHKKMLQLPGFDKLKNWSQYEVVPANKSFEKLVAYVGQHNDLNVLGANIGSRSTNIVSHSPTALTSILRSDVGTGQSLAPLIDQVPIEKFHRWLPFEMSVEELHHHLLNKSLYPATIPTSPEDLMIEHAIAREALRLVYGQAHPDNLEQQWNLVIGAGRPLTGVPQAAHAAMVLIDGLEPWGVTKLVLDRNGMVNMLGLIAAIAPAAAAQATTRDAFLNLGTVIALAGHGQPGKTAVRLKITTPETGETEAQEVHYGDVALIPLPGDQKATLEIRPTRYFDIGLGQPGRGAIAEIEGGQLGIIVDARGRPLKLSRDDEQRQENLRGWLGAFDISYAPPVD